MDIVVSTKVHPKVGETVLGSDLKYFPGGKGANQAVASAKLGAETILIGKVGNDPFGKQLLIFLQEQNVKTQVSIEEKMATGTAIIAVSEATADNTIVVVSGANSLLTEQEVTKVQFEKGDVLISQFEIHVSTIIAFFRKGREVGTINIFNPAPMQSIPDELFELIDVLILNETELSSISGLVVNISNEESITTAIKKIQKENLSVVVTLGEKGIIAFHGGEVMPVPGRKVQAVDTTGAGDCFVGAFGASMVEGKSFLGCLKFANIAASISVTRKGAGSSMPYLEEVTPLI